MSPDQASLKAELSRFHGTRRYFKNFTGLLYTEGIQYLAERAGAYWLIDLVGSYQPHLADCVFQLWNLQVHEDRSALVTMMEDTDEPIRVSQELPFTDFPLDELSFYCIRGVMLLKGEY